VCVAQIRVFGVQRTTEGFDARKFCDKRKYEYILPAWAFDPQAAAHGRPEQHDRLALKKPKLRQPGNSSARLADEAAALQAIAAAVLAAPLEQPAQTAAAAAAAAATGHANGASGDPSSSSAAPAAAAAVAEDGVSGQPGSSKSSGAAVSKGDVVEDEMASTSKVGADVLQRLR